MDIQVLTVHHYDEKEESEDRRITLSVSAIYAVAAGVEDIVLRGRSLRSVTLLITDGESVGLNLNHSDLERVEQAVGSYCLG